MFEPKPPPLLPHGSKARQQLLLARAATQKQVVANNAVPCEPVPPTGGDMAARLGGEELRRRWMVASARRRRERRQTPPRGKWQNPDRPAAAVRPATTLVQLEQCALRTRGAAELPANRTVHVSGLRGECTQIAAMLTSVFEGFGRIAAITVRPRAAQPRHNSIQMDVPQPSWALISFDCTEAARLALQPVSYSINTRALTAAGLTVRPLEIQSTGLAVCLHRGNDNLVETLPPEVLREHAARCMVNEVDLLVNHSLAEAACFKPRSAASFVPGQTVPRDPVGALSAPCSGQGCFATPCTLGPASYVASLLSPRSGVAKVAQRQEVWRRIHAANESVTGSSKETRSRH